MYQITFFIYLADISVGLSMLPSFAQYNHWEDNSTPIYEECHKDEHTHCKFLQQLSLLGWTAC